MRLPRWARKAAKAAATWLLDAAKDKAHDTIAERGERRPIDYPHEERDPWKR